VSQLTRCEGVVLRSRRFMESSKISTIFTKNLGRLDLLARGARKPGSRFGAALEPGTEAEFIVYSREDSSLWTLSAIDILKSNQNLRENLPVFRTLAAVLNTTYALSPPGQANLGLYNLLLAVLNSMYHNTFWESLYSFYLWRAAVLSGYAPSLDRGCLLCGSHEKTGFSIAHGGFLCSQHLQGEVDIFKLNDKELHFLKQLKHSSASDIDSEFPSILIKLIKKYASYHLHLKSSLLASKGFK